MNLPSQHVVSAASTLYRVAYCERWPVSGVHPRYNLPDLLPEGRNPFLTPVQRLADHCTEADISIVRR